MSTIINILISIIAFVLKNYHATDKNQEKINKLVLANKHLLSEVTKKDISEGIKNVNQEISTTTNTVHNSDSLQRANDAINTHLHGDK